MGWWWRGGGGLKFRGETLVGMENNLMGGGGGVARWGAPIP